MPAVAAFQYANPDWIPYTWWVSFYFGVSSAVIAHNHQHCPTFVSKRWNQFMGDWLSVFYGYPTFAWVPTHNLNHHRFVNKAGDATITWRITNSHNLFVAVTYFFVSSYYQATPINEFIRKARKDRPDLFRSILRQYVACFGTHAVLLGLAMYLHGVSHGLFVWAMSLGLPAFFALWTVMLFNYEQHVHTDPWSKYNHSRNWEGKLLNFLLFNNGFHTAHHDNAGMHWSQLAEAHWRIAEHIDPSLRQKSLWWYWCKQYILSPLIPSLGSKQVGRPPFAAETGQVEAPVTASVSAEEAGTNAARA